MLDVLKLLILSIFCVLFSHALNCWECDNASSNRACMARGRLRTCQPNQKACQNEVRRGGFGMLISKRCKQARACDNNFVQNLRSAWFPTQCNTETPSSVCRCCCNTNGCNAQTLACTSRPRINLRLNTCSPPRPPRNGVVKCSAAKKVSSLRNRMNLGTECTFSCGRGFIQLGVTKSTCDQSKKSSRPRFNRPAPLCTPNTCFVRQGPPENGDVTCTEKNEISSVCTFNCHKGYVIEGPTSSRCLATRSWSAKRPMCVPKQCRKVHDNPTNGLVTCEDGANIGSRCGFQCEEGFAMHGSPLSVCVDDQLSPNFGKWTTLPPTCLQIQCEPQTVPFNGEVTCTDGRNEGSVCEYACAPGFYVIGSSSVTCLDDKNDDEFGAWSGPPPRCRPVFCRLLRLFQNGRFRCDKFNLVGSRCRFSCNPGFDMVGAPRSVCTQSDERNAEWSSPTPSCQAIQCSPAHPAPYGGKVECSNGNNAGSVCTFSCGFGFNLEGERQSTCGMDALWSSNPPNCIRPECPSKLNSTSLSLHCTDQSFVGSVCSFTCPRGYDVVGDEDTLCQENGEWSHADPTCLEKSCPPPPEANLNSKRECTNERKFESRCDFYCDEGFQLEGAEFVTCAESGNGELKWSNPAPTCKEMVCPELELLRHGNITCSNGNQQGSTCSFACKQSEGYELYPATLANVTCSGDSTWGERTPCCARPCPPYALMDLVLVLDSSSSIGVEKWGVMKSFVRDFLDSFVVSAEASRMSILRFNSVVDTDSLILLGDYPGNKTGLLEAFDEIPYNGRGTNTGKAVRYVNDVILVEENGDRKGVKDVVVVITDGRAQDGALLAAMSRRIRRRGALVYAIGIAPDRKGALDERQLLRIAGSRERVLIARSGFEQLGEILMEQLSSQICDQRCFDGYDG